MNTNTIVASKKSTIALLLSGKINDTSLQHALRNAIAMVMATYLAVLLHFDAPYWASDQCCHSL